MEHAGGTTSAAQQRAGTGRFSAFMDHTARWSRLGSRHKYHSLAEDNGA